MGLLLSCTCSRTFYDMANISFLFAIVFPFLPTAREGNVFTVVCLSTIGPMATGSWFGLVAARSVRILLECFLVFVFEIVGSTDETSMGIVNLCSVQLFTGGQERLI